MCGRYALSLTANNVRVQVEEQLERPVRAWEDEEDYNPARGYNIAPRTRNPIILRGGASGDNPVEPSGNNEQDKKVVSSSSPLRMENMQWGLIPHWMKRPQESGAQLKTINARDDTVQEGGSMWKSIRGRKRCIVIAEGFYEWLKKGNDRLPYHTKRKDGKLMCFAGLWDSVTYEGEKKPLHTYTIITTNSNKQLAFLHDRMPVILPSAEAIETWLDTSDGQWSPKLSALLKPFEGELECYPVPKEVGKVGNQSADFLKPVSERKGNIASFFGKQVAKQEAKDDGNSSKEIGKEEKATDSKTKAQSPKSQSESPEAKPVSSDDQSRSTPDQKETNKANDTATSKSPDPKIEEVTSQSNPIKASEEGAQPLKGSDLPLNPDDNEKINTRSQSAPQSNFKSADSKEAAIVLDDSEEGDLSDPVVLDDEDTEGTRSAGQAKSSGKSNKGKAKDSKTNKDKTASRKRKQSGSPEPKSKQKKTTDAKRSKSTAATRIDAEGNQKLENYFEIEDD